nr:hypothetical protein CTI12_AA453190 [Tanacetum cinerariifolium]
AEGSSETTTERYMENYKNVPQEIHDQLNAEAEAIQIILTMIDNDIYSTVDACPNACETWKAIERLKQGESINVQDLETNLYWEFGKFTSRDEQANWRDDTDDELKDQELEVHYIYMAQIQERLEKESKSLESSALDNKDNYCEGLPNDGSNLNSYLVLASNSLEPKGVEIVDEKQAHVEFEVKKDSSLEANQDHAEFMPRYGSESSSQDDYHKWELLDDNFMGSSQVEAKRERDPNQMDTTMKILEWNMKAPLEIIYEAYEGEEEEDEENNDNNMVSNDKEIVGCERYPSLSLYYPESDTDSSSDSNFPMDAN